MSERVGLYAISKTELVRRKIRFKKGVGSVSVVLPIKF